MDFLDCKIGALARDIPGAAAIFHSFQIDFGFNGGMSLRDALLEKEINPRVLIATLENLELNSSGTDAQIFENRERTIEHVLNRYHDTNSKQIPELIRLAKRVERVHGNSVECPVGIATCLEDLRTGLDPHLIKEEEILFPMLARGFKKVALPAIKLMRQEHAQFGLEIRRLRELTNGYEVPINACHTWQNLYARLYRFDRDFVDHIHLENNVLFEKLDNLLAK